MCKLCARAVWPCPNPMVAMFGHHVVDPEGANDYPIVSFTWLLLYKKYSDPAKLKALKEFVTWSLTDGQSFSESLGYVPLPEAVIEKSKAALATVQ